MSRKRNPPEGPPVQPATAQESEKTPPSPAPAQAEPPESDASDSVVAGTPPNGGLPFPIVAVGASAGGIEALTELLRALPADTGMALVVIQHLSPTYESRLPEILGRATQLPVSEVKGDTAVEVGHVYVIPPNRDLVFESGMLKLAPRSPLRGQARAIDRFMRSLAEGHGHKSIGVVLSGTANDGTAGLEEIKAAGGISFAQDATAEQTGMPRSAIAAGAVDSVLPPAEIARELERIARHPYVAPGEGDRDATPDPAFGRVLEVLRTSSGVDFANYKRNTLQRRITRRMVLHKLDGLRDYLRLLQSSPEEVEALYQDVLINVTSFFRNPEAYEALKHEVFPRLTHDRNRHEPLRVWVLGCSSGEEAYSIAMAYTEYSEATGRRVPMQIFATDVNGRSIDKARAATYPRRIADDMSPERLRRFFVEAHGGYRVAKPIRDMCVFAQQNALADPPFSRMDLVACRNMLIYLEPVLQKRMLPLLHYALRPEGFLWLGGSETIGTHRDLFELLDPRNKIYHRKGPKRRAPAVAVPMPRLTSLEVAARAQPVASDLHGDSQREADRAVLMRYAPPGVLLDDQLEVVQFRGDTGAYLAPAPGRASLGFLKMLREGLLVAVRGALHRARRSRATVREEGLKVRTDTGWREVDVVVMPVRTGWLVLFEEPANRAEARARAVAAEARAAVDRIPPSADESGEQEAVRLKQELAATREYLQSVIEQQEAANEELQSANEEVQSANEELQSINEELETSKEEIQSTNEELATVNDELQHRNVELSEANSDLTNLFSSVNIPIVMLGPDLRIRRFTPPAEKVLNLINADVGRPIADLKLAVDAPDLEARVVEVIEGVTPYEREVRDRDGHWYLLRIRPYRTVENRIDGAVIALVDIDTLRRAQQSMRESEQRFEVLADSAPVLIWLSDLEGCRFVNRAFEDFVGAKEGDIRSLGLPAFVHPDERQAYVDGYAEAVRRRQRFEMRTRLRRGDGTYRWMKVVASPRIVTDGSLVGFVGSAVDITDMAQAEAALLQLDRGKDEFLAMLAHELRNPLSGVRNAVRLLGEARDAAMVDKARAIIERQTGQMMRMIDDLLDVSRIAYGKIRLRAEPVDLIDVIRSSIEATEAEREQQRQLLTADLPDGPMPVNGDPVRLQQVFMNLLGNASKFTREAGHVWVSAEAEPAARGMPAPRVMVRVRDDGAGIDPALLPRVFDLFVQGDRAAGRTRGGIGLGLALAKRLVDLHGGTVEAHSAGEGLGSEFVVRLPLLQGVAVRAPAKVDAGASLAGRGVAKRVLIVDDNLDGGESLRLVMALAGHEAHVVQEGAKVLEAAARLRPDVVLLDIGLPDRDGYQVARELRADPRTRDTFIVAVTGFGREDDRARSAEAGFDLHLTKPVDADALLDEMARGPVRARP